MEAKIEGIEDLVKVGNELSNTLGLLNKFVSTNIKLIPEEHRHLLEGIDKKSLSELENLKSQIDKLGA